MVHHSKCPLCFSGNTGKYLQTRDYFLSKEVFELYKCSGCGFIFTQDHPDENAISRYYESADYISHNDSAIGIANKLYRLSRNIMLNKKMQVIRRHTGLKKGSILDIGSGTGYFSAFMKKRGWQVSGIEINKKAREYSISRFGVYIMSPDRITSLPAGNFDCITLWHVLEHFQEPFKYTSEIFRLLKPGGICLIALPNCNSFDAEHYGEFWAAFDVPRHLWHFTPDTFGIFAEKTGFEVKCLKRLPFDVFYISTLSEKYKGTKSHFIKGMIKGLWFALCSLFRKGKSSSLLYLLQKKSD